MFLIENTNGKYLSKGSTKTFLLGMSCIVCIGEKATVHDGNRRKSIYFPGEIYIPKDKIISIEIVNPETIVWAK